MDRPFTDITVAVSGQPINNYETIVTCTFAGQYSKLSTYTKHTPTIETIRSKYGNRFYNGIFVTLTDGQTVIGG